MTRQGKALRKEKGGRCLRAVSAGVGVGWGLGARMQPVPGTEGNGRECRWSMVGQKQKRSCESQGVVRAVNVRLVIHECRNNEELRHCCSRTGFGMVHCAWRGSRFMCITRVYVAHLHHVFNGV